MKFVDGYPYNFPIPVGERPELPPADDSVLRSGGQMKQYGPRPRISTRPPAGVVDTFTRQSNAGRSSIAQALAAIDSLQAENDTLRHENDCLKYECSELHGMLNSIRRERDTANAKTFGRMP